FPSGRNSHSHGLGSTLTSLEQLSSLISDTEQDKDIPILLKHYLRLGGRALAFSVDRAFSQVLDGLIVVDLRLAPQNLLERYLGKDGAAQFIGRHRAEAANC